MLLEHPVSCVRHSAKDFLPLLVSNPSLQNSVIDYTFKLPVDKRSYFIGVGALANELGARVLIERDPNITKQLIKSLHDPTIISHVSFKFSFLFLFLGFFFLKKNLFKMSFFRYLSRLKV